MLPTTDGINQALAHHLAYLASSPHVCRKGRKLQEQDVNKVSSASPASVLLHVKLLCCIPHSCSRVTTHVPAMYGFHQEQHFYTLQLAKQKELKSTDSWVMTSPNEAGFVKLPNERILFTSPPRTHLQISTPNTYPGTEPFSAKSDAGVVYITNQRVRKAFRAWASTDDVVDSLPTFDLHPRAPILLRTHTQPPRYLRASTILWCQLLGRTLQASPRRWHPTQ